MVTSCEKRVPDEIQASLEVKSCRTIIWQNNYIPVPVPVPWSVLFLRKFMYVCRIAIYNGDIAD